VPMSVLVQRSLYADDHAAAARLSAMLSIYHETGPFVSHVRHTFTLSAALQRCRP